MPKVYGGQQSCGCSASWRRRAWHGVSDWGTSFVTSRKGFWYLIIKIARQNDDIMKIRAYTISPQDKRDMRRFYPDVTFDWKKIAVQLATHREACRQYRSRRQTTRRRTRVPREPFYGVVEPRTRTVYVNDPGNIAAMGALLDALIAQDVWSHSEDR